ncbi:hypothetical protein AAHA92_05583 [Salvia divinorum]|uniref:Sieve element occlusion N-terminal domain-containing protein n=1 Tax=Salvia divinorum TaxID=28513 RepID=A0ABD1I633_SALDI
MATASKKLVSAADESALRKKILETHAYDGGAFDSNSILATVEGILNLVTPGADATFNDPTNDIGMLDGTTLPAGLPETLPFMLHKISCVLTCKCSGGDSHTSAMEILKLLSSYTWEAKIVIVLASYVVDYAQFSLLTKLYTTHPLAKLIAILKQIPQNLDDISDLIRSKLDTIISLVKLSIEVTKFITKFNTLPSHIQ